MAGSDRDVRLNVIIDEDGRGAGKAADDLDRIDKSAGKADASLRKLGDSTKRVDGDIQKHRQSIKELATEYEKTGNTDLFKSIRKDRSAITMLEKVKKELGNMEDAGKEAGTTFASGLQGALKTPGVGLAVGGVVVAGIVAAAPMIGAALNSAVLLGVGGGALAGGIALAVKDEKVSAAFGQLGTTAMEGLTKASSVFVGPLLKSADIFGSAFARVLPTIERSFASLSGVVEPLARGLAGFATNAMPGLSKALEASKPILMLLARELPNIGNAVSDFFGSIAKGAPGAIMFFQMLLDITKDLIVGFGNAIEFLAKGFEKLSGFFAGMNPVARAAFGPLAGYMAEAHDKSKDLVLSLGDMKSGFDGTAPGIDLTAANLQKLSGVINQTELTADTLAGQMADKLFGALMSADQATLSFEQSLTRLHENLESGANAIDIHTAAGQKNREMVLGAIQTNIRLYDTNIANGMSAQDAAKAYDQNTESLRRQLQQAGFTAGQIDTLIGKYSSVPDNVNTNIATNGLASAINGLADLMRAINGIPRYTAITIEERHRTTYSNDTPPSQYFRGNRFGGIHYAAQGLLNLSGVAGIFPARSTPTFGFAESGTGGEAFVAKNAPHSRSLQIADEAAQWHGGMVVPKGSASGGGSSAPSTLNVIFGGNTDGAFATAFQMLVRTGAIQLQTS